MDKIQKAEITITASSIFTIKWVIIILLIFL